MALAGSDSSSQLTSNDLEALADIQAELERIGSGMADDGSATENYKLEQAIDVSLAEIETSTVINTSSSTFNVVNSDDVCPVLQDVVVESHSSPLPPESTLEHLIEEEVVEDEHEVMEEGHEVAVEEQMVEGHELVEEEQIVEEMHETVLVEEHQEMVEEEQVVEEMSDVNATIVGDFTEATEVISTPKEIGIQEAPKVLKPIYIIPNRTGGKTVTVTTAASSSGDNISRLIFTATNPISTVAGSGSSKPIITCTSKEAIDPKALAHAVMKSHVLQGVAGSGNTITKVIITSNPITGQSSTQTVSFAPGSPLAAAVASAAGPNAVITGMSQPLKIVATGTSQGSVGAAGGKTVTLAQTGLGSPLKPQIFTAVPGTPSKQQTIMVSKIALSPKTPTKIMIPVTVGKSPQKIAPAPLGTNAQFITKQGLLTALTGLSTTTMTTTAPKLGSIAVSPSKLIFKQASPQTLSLKPGTLASATSAGTMNSIGSNIKHITVATSTGVQPIQVPGSKFSYIRLVSAPSGTTSIGGKSQMLTAVARPIAPATQTSSVSSQVQLSTGSQLKIAVPIGSGASGQLIGQPMVASKHLTTGQRILIPASNVTGVSNFRPSSGNIAVPANALTQLPPGTTLFSPSGNLGNIVMLPAQYVTQFQSQVTQAQAIATSTASITTPTISQASILPAKSVAQHQSSAPNKTAASSLPPPSISHERIQSHASSKLQINGRSTLEPDGVRPRKPCNCTKSQCLKLYCDCFANGEFCHNCNCNNCYNNLEHEEDRQKAIKACLERNPHAFHPKIGKGNQGEIERRHNKGCNCKRSGCLKNYCECYEAKIMCSYMCKCIGCKNFADSAEKKTLMHLADAAEVRVQQQTAAKSKLSSQMHDVASKGPAGSATGERLPSSFITNEVVEATCQCLLAQAEAGKEKNQPEEVVEKLVIEEFGRCLLQIIDYASKTKV